MTEDHANELRRILLDLVEGRTTRTQAINDMNRLGWLPDLLPIKHGQIVPVTRWGTGATSSVRVPMPD